MATPRSPIDGARRGGRNISHPLVRRTTKGPLDAEEDPLAGSAQSTTASSVATSPKQQPEQQVHAIVSLPAPALQDQRMPAVDVKFIQDRRAYHKLPTDDIPEAFIKSAQQPPLGTPLADLLRGGHFRRAAETALDELLHTPADQLDSLLQLLYCRLACLILVGRHDLAADEAIPLYEYLGGNSPAIDQVLACMLWELRVLLVRLQLFAAQDGGRRGIMAIYGLASEVRAYVRAAKDTDSRELWQKRLQQLGLRVADALVEIGELETACRHLDSLQDGDQNEIFARKVLLHIHNGNLVAADYAVGKIANEQLQVVLEALLASVKANAVDGHDSWHRLSTSQPHAALAKQNEALFLLYTGRIVEARSLLETAVKEMPANSTMLFNLSTIYELCSDKALQQKLALSDALSQREPTAITGGWERSMSELKL